MKVVFYDKDKTPANLDNFWEIGTSGTVRALFSLARGLSSRGHEVVILNRSPSGVFGGVKHIHTRNNEQAWNHLRSITEIDIVVANNWADDIFAQAVEARRRVYWMHNYTDISPYEGRLARREIDRILCVSKHQLETYRSSAFFSRMDFAYFPLLEPPFSLKCPAERDDVIIFAGALREGKGFADAVRIFLRFHELFPRYVLRVAGSADLHSAKGDVKPGTFIEDEYKHKYLHSLLHDTDGRRHPAIQLLGRLSHRELYGELSKAKLCLQNPSWLNEPETFGFAFVEAQLMEVPVITAARGAHGENIIDGKTGVLVKGHHDEDFVDAMIELQQDENKRRAMGRRGRKHVQEKLAFDLRAGQIERLFSRWLEIGG